jgi:quinone-modifying oxidoreductase subunit QmoB
MVTGAKNIGVYICTGCNIGQAINTESLERIAGGYPMVKRCARHENLCSRDSCRDIADDIRKEALDGIVIAACSQRVATNAFRFNGVFTERVNLREGVAWIMEPGNEDTQVAAEDYLRMGIERTVNSRVPQPYLIKEPSSEILVLGGGITGIQCAVEASRAGFRVHLVEKEGSLGGWLNRLNDIIPIPGSTKTDPKEFLRDMLVALESSDNINVLTRSTIESVEGEPGHFAVTISQDGKKTVQTAGSIILANGWQPYDANKLTHLGYDKHQDFITQVELEEMAKKGKVARPSDGKTPDNILFIQCAGSRDRDHLPYCSNVCCLTTLKQALYVREHNPGSNVFIIYKDIRTPGKNEHYYHEVQRDSRIFLTKGVVSSVQPGEDGQFQVTVDESLFDDRIIISADLVVAATGMVPNSSEDLHLRYRKGEGLPELKYGFPDSHFICFPYETQRTGIYAAGAARMPQGIRDCMDDASGAVVKAIQCIESIKRGEAVHPRSGDLSYPDLFMARCTDCKRCTEECPFGSYDETEKGTPLPNPARCRRCGICMGSCPERIINFDDYSIHAVSSMIKSISMPDEFEEKPRILAFICENDAYPAFDMAALHRIRISPYLRVIPVRCIGSVNKIWLSDALSAGFDGILQIGCKPGDDYQCHYITGSELMETRAENIQETLQTMMLEPERIHTEFLEIDEYYRIPKIIEDYLGVIEDMGPNPFKDM